VTIFAWQRREARGVNAFVWYLIGWTLWIGGFILELLSPSLQGKIFWDSFQFLAGLVIIIAFPIFVIQYTGYKLPHPKLILAASMVVPALFTVLVLTDKFHHQIYPDPRLVEIFPFGELTYTFTPVVYSYAAYGYLITLGSLALLIIAFLHPHQLFRFQVAAIAFGVLIIIAGTLLSLAGVSLTQHRYTSPFTMAIGNLAIAWALFRYRLFDIVPIARHNVVENMSDLVIILDTQNRIVDINPIALYAIEKESKDVIGKFAGEIFAEWPKLLREFEEPSNKSVRTTLSAYGKTYHHEVKATLLHSQRGEYIGRVFVSRDVTAYVELQENLERLNNQLEQRVQERTQDLEEAYDTTLEGWAKALELRDKETEGHSRRVTETTMKLALALDIPREEFEHIRRGAILHDIGKMAIPDEILRKTGPLTPVERDIVLQHPTIAYELLSRIPFLQKALDIPYCHHEKWDGTGYPRGLKGREIPLAARIFAVADVWDAVQSDRPYKKGWPRQKTITYMQAQAGKHFDPEIVKTFLQLAETGKI